VGSAWDFQNRLGPLIQPPQGALQQALTHLEPEESWALKPENRDGNPRLWTPGIKWGVRPNSTTHLTEFFGPLLGVMRAENLEQAIDLVNQTGYGLTSGLESLDQREQNLWQKKIKAGNLYINRETTGARVQRQPFGGMGKSSLGSGLKAGGPNYAAQFVAWEEIGFPTSGALEQDHGLLRQVQEWEKKLDWGQLSKWEKDLNKTIRAVRSYLYRFEHEFLREKDFFHLRGQDNRFGYLPVGTVLIRLHPDDSLFEILARISAARITCCRLMISAPLDFSGPAADFLKGPEGRRFMAPFTLEHQTDEDIIRLIPTIQRIRCASPERVPLAVYQAAAREGLFIARSPVLMEGRIELLWYLREQVICDNYHRYGNLGERAG
jgi:RHH-type proline utilization regulon transcriptional repressor/proline dehydrogenase/delta 1-pyrroline-5-carboxylate dehydrogenase